MFLKEYACSNFKYLCNLCAKKDTYSLLIKGDNCKNNSMGNKMSIKQMWLFSLLILFIKAELLCKKKFRSTLKYTL